jgi:hypothetical protein
VNQTAMQQWVRSRLPPQSPEGRKELRLCIKNQISECEASFPELKQTIKNKNKNCLEFHQSNCRKHASLESSFFQNVFLNLIFNLMYFFAGVGVGYLSFICL